ncbi:MAG: gliding motility protein GldN [Bacteroidota bacterium]
MRSIAITTLLCCLIIKSNLKAQSLLSDAPLDDITEKHLLKERRVLSYAPVREADILWEKKIWRIIDTREKINSPFRYPDRTFFDILLNAIFEQKIKAYSTEDDRFSRELSRPEIEEQLFRKDTFEIVDPETYEVTYQIVRHDINPEEIVRYRLKEVAFFDSRTSRMQTRLLGIAPIRSAHTENGVVKYETPLFWIYYPHCREVLAHEPVITGFNDLETVSWEDIFEMRYFSSYIYKQSNIKDERIQDYLSGRDILVESEKIKNELFNLEQDLWSY